MPRQQSTESRELSTTPSSSSSYVRSTLLAFWRKKIKRWDCIVMGVYTSKEIKKTYGIALSKKLIHHIICLHLRFQDLCWDTFPQTLWSFWRSCRSTVVGCSSGWEKVPASDGGQSSVARLWPARSLWYPNSKHQPSHRRLKNNQKIYYIRDGFRNRLWFMN